MRYVTIPRLLLLVLRCTPVRLLAAVFFVAAVVLSIVEFGGHRAEGLGPQPQPPSGSYSVEMNVISDPSGHQQYIQMPHNIKLRLGAYGVDDAVFSGPAPFVSVEADTESPSPTRFDKDLLSGAWEFDMSGTGTVAGHQNVTITFSGQFNLNGGVSGVYTKGAGGELPGGLAIEYQVKNGAPPLTFTPTLSPTATIAPTTTPTPTTTRTPTPTVTLPPGVTPTAFPTEPVVCTMGPGSCTPTATPPNTPAATPTARYANDGDCNGDHYVNSTDAVLILQYDAGLIPRPDNADVNHDLMANVLDAILVLQRAVGLISHWPLP